MLSDHLLIPNWHLPFGMFITYLLKQLNFNLSNEQSIEPSVDLNNTLLKRMRVREHPPAPPPPPVHPAVHLPGSSSGSSTPPDPYAALSTQIREYISAELTAHRQQISEEMSTHYHNLENDMSYICDSIRYMESRLDDIYLRREWAAPVPSPHARPLPTVGPHFQPGLLPLHLSLLLPRIRMRMIRMRMMRMLLLRLILMRMRMRSDPLF